MIIAARRSSGDAAAIGYPSCVIQQNRTEKFPELYAKSGACSRLLRARGILALVMSPSGSQFFHSLETRFLPFSLTAKFFVFRFESTLVGVRKQARTELFPSRVQLP